MVARFFARVRTWVARILAVWSAFVAAGWWIARVVTVRGAFVAAGWWIARVVTVRRAFVTAGWWIVARVVVFAALLHGRRVRRRDQQRRQRYLPKPHPPKSLQCREGRTERAEARTP